jgi:hypothetical protein
MASGRVNRANRPNTWLLRPTLQVKILLANPEPSTHGPTRTFCGTIAYVGCLRTTGLVMLATGLLASLLLVCRSMSGAFANHPEF